MSQRADITVVVQGVALLLEAVAEAGAEILERRRLAASDGTVHDVDWVARDASGAEVGVKVDPRTERATFVPADCEGGKGKALAGRIAQRYARSRVLQDLRAKGYEVAREETGRDGTVKLVLARWR
ncbi:MAG TPA: DUF1257 domain-containing protein [Anaeromyxobacteraceae bacterium]|nr:DUF1257 domain-containing protein [Anaeromyxobacteraceae bacterium]